MGIFDKMRDFALTAGMLKAPYEDDEEMDYEDSYDNDIVINEKYDRREKAAPPTVTAIKNKASANSRIMEINPATRTQIMLVAPKSIEDAGLICDYLLDNKIVSINMEKTDHSISQRVIDFISGAAYALGGHIESSGLRTFVVAPHNTEITNSLKDEIMSGGIMFNYKNTFK